MDGLFYKILLRDGGQKGSQSGEVERLGTRIPRRPVSAPLCPDHDGNDLMTLSLSFGTILPILQAQWED